MAAGGPAARRGWKQAVPRQHRTPGRLVQVILMLALSAAALFPLAFMIAGAFRTPAAWAQSTFGLPTTASFSGFTQAWRDASIGIYLRNSVIVTAAATMLGVAVGCLGGYAFSKLDWRGRRVTYFAVIVWLAVPPVALMVPEYILMAKLGLINTFLSVILFYTALNTPFNVYLMATYFRALPDDLLEAARMDRAGVHRIFLQVLLPLARPAVATLCIFNALFAWNEFVFALLFLEGNSVKTAMVGVLQLYGRFSVNNQVLVAGLLLISIPMIAAYLFFQRFLVRAVIAGAVK